MEEPTPKDDRVGKRIKTNYELLIRILQAGLTENNQLTEILIGKAKSSLTASTVVLGIISTGTGIVLAALSTNSTGWIVVELKTWTPATVIIGSTGFAGIVFIVFSIIWSIRALKVIKIDSAFSSQLLTDRGDGRMNIKIWKNVSELAIYERMIEWYHVAMREQEKRNDRMGPMIEGGQTFLGLGLVLWIASVCITVGMLMFTNPL